MFITGGLASLQRPLKTILGLLVRMVFPFSVDAKERQVAFDSGYAGAHRCG